MTARRHVVACAISLSAMLEGCALTGKNDALSPRFFTPETTLSPPLKPPADGASLVDLRLGRVTATSDLKENIAFRDGAHEVGYYDERLWTEKPDAYLLRALTRALFEQRALRHVLSGVAPTLDVRLVAFEEIHTAPRRVRVQVALSLHDERVVRIEETLTVERPLSATAGPSSPEEVAAAMGDALAEITSRIGDRVEKSLRVP